MEKRRNTIQKMKILEYLSSVKTHPTAEKVYSEVKKSIPAISLGTIYRNLNSMAREGKILKLDVGGESRYDYDSSEHAHCVCNICGKVIDSCMDKLPARTRKGLEEEGFEIDNIKLIAYGRCKDCRGG